MLLCQNINPNCIEANYHLYYDETNNIKKYRINEYGSTNVPTNTIFVLGGIEGCGYLSFEELKKRFKLQKTVKEVKSHHVYSGIFTDCLKSTRLEAFLDLIMENGWHVHFQSLNLLYWSIVDILDSINGFHCQETGITYALKAALYQVAKCNQKEMINLMYRYSYPDIKDEKSLKNFFKELTSLVINSETKDCPEKFSIGSGLLKKKLVEWLMQGFSQKEAVFIQQEQELVLLNELSELYRSEIYTWKNSELTIDNEADIIPSIEKFDVELSGEIINNYTFVDSLDNTMVQLSDVAVGIISRYLDFIDLEGYNVPVVVKNTFNERQMRVFKKLNKLLKISRDYNPVFFHQTTSIEYNGMLNDYIDMYH